jgi:two-component system OmpR family sensor kinase
MRPGDPALVPASAPHEEYVTWQLLSADGRLLAHSHGAATVAPRPVPEPGFFDTRTTRTFAEPSADGAYVFLLSEPAAHRGHAIRATLLQLLLPMGLLILGALLLVPVVVRRAMRPVREFEAALVQRGGANLAEIDSLGLPQELSPIRQDVNLLLRRLRQALEAERSFTANAAHELRTPVAAAMAQAQLLTRELPPGEPPQARATAIAEELRRLGRRVEKLLQLGRAEAGVALRLGAVDLLTPLHLLIDQMPERGRIRVEQAGDDGFLVHADLDMLAIALRNLLENALLHGDLASPVTVRLRPGEVSVRNAGPMVPAARLRDLSTRFVRHSDARGSGLGLAIVRTVAEQSGGSLELFSPARGQADGFEAVLRLPQRGPWTPAPAGRIGDA